MNLIYWGRHRRGLLISFLEATLLVFLLSTFPLSAVSFAKPQRFFKTFEVYTKGYLLQSGLQDWHYRIFIKFLKISSSPKSDRE
jgi:hypothetical protein